MPCSQTKIKRNQFNKKKTTWRLRMKKKGLKVLTVCMYADKRPRPFGAENKFTRNCFNKLLLVWIQ